MLKYLKILYVQVLIAIAIGILLGHFYPDIAVKMQPLGRGFINLIKMIIAPLIFCTVVTGIAGMSDVKSVGKTGGIALAYFMVLTTVALIIGVGMNVDVSTFGEAERHLADQYAGKAHSNNLVNFFMNIIPKTFASAFTSGEILQVLLVAVLFACALHFSGARGRSSLISSKVFRKSCSASSRSSCMWLPWALSGPWPSPSARKASVRWFRWVS